MKLVIGLGNPGSKYDGTRHNVGFEVLDELRRRHGAGRAKTNFQAELFEVSIAGRIATSEAVLSGVTIRENVVSEKLLLVRPQTFMNLSGTSVLGARDFYKVVDSDILVVCDDFNLPLGRLRLRPQGSAGGQKGLADIVRRLGTDLVPRLRIGVGPLPVGWNAPDFVLGKFAKDQRIEIEISVVRAADAVADWVTQGMASAMNKYNGD